MTALIILGQFDRVALVEMIDGSELATIRTDDWHMVTNLLGLLRHGNDSFQRLAL
jgi:hypothetical protein